MVMYEFIILVVAFIAWAILDTKEIVLLKYAKNEEFSTNAGKSPHF